MKLIPLGTNGYHPSFGRQTASYLLLTDTQAILLDAGTGLSRLLEPGIRKHIEHLSTLSIILSHYHLDHIVGLSYLPGVWSEREVTLYAPAPPLVAAAPEEALARLFAPPLFVHLEDFPLAVKVVPILEDRFSIGGLDVRVRAQRHPGGSIGIRIADSVAYLTDTVHEDGPLPFVAGVRLLLHETWFLDPVDEAAAESIGHSQLSRVLSMAAASGISRFMPIHFDPNLENSALERIERAAEAHGIDCTIPIEGRCYDI